MKPFCYLLLILAAFACDSPNPSEPGQVAALTLKNKIVFMRRSADGKMNLFVGNPDGSDIVALTNSAHYYDCPGISPDGEKLSFVGNGAVYVMNVDGTGERLLMPVQNGASFYRCPAWSPHSDKLAFVAMVAMVKQPSPGSIFIIDVSAGTGTAIANGANYTDIEWSPDATRLLVGSSSYTSGGPYDFRVSVLTLDGARVSQVVANWADLSWAPDGTKFVFQCGASARRVCVANADGSNVRALTSADTTTYAPKWSPGLQATDKLARLR